MKLTFPNAPPAPLQATWKVTTSNTAPFHAWTITTTNGVQKTAEYLAFDPTRFANQDELKVVFAKEGDADIDCTYIASDGTQKTANVKLIIEAPISSTIAQGIGDMTLCTFNSSGNGWHATTSSEIPELFRLFGANVPMANGTYTGGVMVKTIVVRPNAGQQRGTFCYLQLAKPFSTLNGTHLATFPVSGSPPVRQLVEGLDGEFPYPLASPYGNEGTSASTAPSLDFVDSPGIGSLGNSLVDLDPLMEYEYSENQSFRLFVMYSPPSCPGGEVYVPLSVQRWQSQGYASRESLTLSWYATDLGSAFLDSSPVSFPQHPTWNWIFRR